MRERDLSIVKIEMVGVAKALLGLLCLAVPAQVLGQRECDYSSWYKYNLDWFLINRAVAPKKFLTIPLGKVRPAGWLMDQVPEQRS